MKNNPKNILTTDRIVILLSLILTVYFLYSFILPLIEFINTKTEITDYISIINGFFK